MSDSLLEGRPSPAERASTALSVRDDTVRVVRPEDVSDVLMKVAASRDLYQLSAYERAILVVDTCRSLGLNPRTNPFDWLEFYDPETRGKKLVMYPNKSCTDQLARLHQITIKPVEERIVGTLFKVVLEGSQANGRVETNVAYLDVTDKEGHALKGQRLGNAYMKCYTKAKRRLVLGMVGLMAPPDAEDMPQVRAVTLDGRGNVLEAPTDEQRELAANPALARILGEPTLDETGGYAGPDPGGLPDQRPRPEELEPPTRPFRRTTFHCDAKHWNGVWHMVVRHTFLEEDEARHDFVGWYTENYPANRRTSSLATFLAHATDRQAEALINRARETIAERASFKPALDDDDDDDDGEMIVYPERPTASVEYALDDLRELYATWTSELARRDVSFKPISGPDLVRLGADDLRRELDSVIGQVDSIDIMMALDDQPDVSPDADDDDAPPAF